MNKKGYTLRKYNNEDYEFIYETKKNAYKEYVEQCWRKWDDIDQRNRFKESMEKTFDRIYIIMVDNKRIGFYQGQAVNERTYYIENICIIPEYQGKGIGKELLLKMKKHLKSNGCEKIMIAVFGYNESAIKFCKENGFHIRMVDMIED